MGKHAKTALMVLYALQLAVVFRDQLGQLYRSAIESVRHEMTSRDESPRTRAEAGQSGGGWKDVLHVIISIAKPQSREVLMAAAIGHAAMIHEDHGGGHFHPQHPTNDPIDNERRRQRRKHYAWGYFIRNLYAEIRRDAAAPSSIEPRIHAMLRLMTFGVA